MKHVKKHRNYPFKLVAAAEIKPDTLQNAFKSTEYVLSRWMKHVKKHRNYPFKLVAAAEIKPDTLQKAFKNTEYVL
jgi:hypothetical protein